MKSQSVSAKLTVSFFVKDFIDREDLVHYPNGLKEVLEDLLKTEKLSDIVGEDKYEIISIEEIN